MKWAQYLFSYMSGAIHTNPNCTLILFMRCDSSMTYLVKFEGVEIYNLRDVFQLGSVTSELTLTKSAELKPASLLHR